jgi:hypothetical protein
VLSSFIPETNSLEPSRKPKPRNTHFHRDELETVKEFKYLGRITSDDDDDLQQ